MRLVDGEEIIRKLEEELEKCDEVTEPFGIRVGLLMAARIVQEAETLNTRSKGLGRWYQGYKKGFDTGYIKGHDDGIALVKESAENG